MKSCSWLTLMTLSFGAVPFASADSNQLELSRIDALEKSLQGVNQELAELRAHAAEVDRAKNLSKTDHAISGYGEFNFHTASADGASENKLDFRRWALQFQMPIGEHIRLVSELELEHAVAAGSSASTSNTNNSNSNGALKLNKAYVEYGLSERRVLKAGILPVPVGTLNESALPSDYYGVERPVVERVILLNDWTAGGIQLTHELNGGLVYDLMISEGLKTPDPTLDESADPFDLQNAQQHSSEADVFAMAVTGRVRYEGIEGLEMAAYAQYQPDLDQNAAENYADSAALLGGHIVYETGRWSGKLLAASWFLGGDAAYQAWRDIQMGGYAELAWRMTDQWGFYGRQSYWSEEVKVDALQTDFGASLFVSEGLILKANVQFQNLAAGNVDGIYAGMGFQF